jgi:cytochrome c biogenesis protein CcmG/thiol:disulfide interchange protein DsbE
MLPRRLRLFAALVALTLVIAACSPGGGAPTAGPIPEATVEDIEALLAGSEQPVVLNVWASWCIPCRSEAPLLREAHDQTGDDVRFVGVAVRDRAGSARDFLDEFGLGGFDHFLDPNGEIPANLGGFGVPLTFFFDVGGELVELHSGIIDERTLALQVDELLRRAG